MNNQERKQKGETFYTALKADEDLHKEFMANPTKTLEKHGIITSEETKIPGVETYYASLAKQLPQSTPDTPFLMLSIWGDVGCWSCKISMGAVVGGAILAATLATGGTDIPALAAALSISDAAAGAAVASAGGAVSQLTSLLLTQICGSC